ncbi:xanthine dehydrogenase family protein molybdopterin-binding subunit [Bradyrhizobium sp. 21]|uniref:xanthine dehydrogenase family protein molybdopterin-binding subunit n=1 Tax=Bradyrhizobium sp. 21 TaxID=2782666 RepID=UPI001FF937B0|nr:xanthine dehydrogenase family protein molybdopterin-binding subunit [Bradyrhizobium sp. 21]MCK1387583.1 xanthine dehydrogenase family protein [Bradyrhizobium sp. 21]
MSHIGRSFRRIEDGPLLLGKGSFAADCNAPGQLHMRVVRSPVAFGRILGVETAEAAALEGVVAIWTTDDVAELPPIDFRQMGLEALAPYRQWVLARDYVRYVGDPVAVVVAVDPYVAEDAADLVFCDIEELAPQLDATAAPSAFMPDIHPGLLSEPAVLRRAYGDVDAAFAAADKIVALEVKVGRHTGVPLETRGALGVYDADKDVLTLYGAAKVPHYNRDAISRMLGLGEGRLHLSEGHVGGGFGIRGELYPEDVLVCAAALRLRRPVKWIEDRKEHLLAANHSRDQVYRLRAAVDRRGFILGLEAEFFTDQGAYVRTHGTTVTDLSAAMLPGPYVIPAYAAVGHIRLTNKTPAGTYRAPGRYESTFARERLIDKIATELDLSPVEVRRVNFIAAEAMPFDRGIKTLGTGVVYDSGQYRDLLERVLDRLSYNQLQDELAARRDRGELVGFGVACFVEKSGLGPQDLVRITVDGRGTVEIVTGVASVGQGVETVLAQICAETIGIPIERINVIHGQTDRIEIGFGAFASRVTVMAGSAVKIASEALRDRALEAAAGLLQTTPDALKLSDGMVEAVSGGASLPLGEIALHLKDSGGLTGEGRFVAGHMTYPYGVHAAQVKVDPSTCGITIERYLVGYDVGRAVNPMLIEGQIVGGAAQGIGGALLEEFVYDENGQPLAASFADYLMPTCHEVPEIEVLLREDAPSPLNPLGVKGAGEAGINAVGAALAAAIDAALQKPGAVTQLPITPARLHEILRGPRS